MEVQVNLFKKQAEIFLDIIKTNYFEYLVKGGFGSGKTTMMGALIMYYARLEGVNIFLGAETLRIIHNALIPKLFGNMTEYEKKITRWNQRDQVIELMWGGHTRHKRNSTIYYASLTKRDDVFMRQRSMDYNFIFIDEASLIDELAYSEILTRARAGKKQKVVLFSNPVGKEHWLYKRFEGLKSVYTMSMLDNPYLPERYKNYFLQFPEEVRKVIVEGEWGDINWRDIEKDLSRNIEQLSDIYIAHLRNTGRLIISADWGYNHSAFVLGGIDDFRRLWILDAFEFEKMTLDEQILELNKELKRNWGIDIHSCVWTGDISAHQTSVFGENIEEYLKRKHNIPLRFFKYGLVDSILTMEAVLKEDIKDLNDRRVKINSKLYRVILALKQGYFWDGNKIEKDKNLEHLADSIRYLINYYWKIYGGGKAEIIYNEMNRRII